MSLLFALLSCQGLLPSSDASVGDPTPDDGGELAVVPEAKAPRPVRMPTTQLVTRQCFGREEYESARRPAPPPSAAPAGPGGMTRSPSPVQAPSTRASSSSAPAKTASSSGGRAQAEAAPVAGAAPSADLAAAPAAEEPAPMLGGVEGGDKKDGYKGREAAKPADSSMVARPEVRPNLDWGATTYLSNDDSMSLASAQRLLWAIQNKAPVSTSQVRPHELLNYFSFDTQPVAAGKLFSVDASAETTDANTLTMAFAVKGALPERQPLDLTLVLDRSGSMSAEGRMDYLKRGLTLMTEQLQRGDRVDIVLFDDELCTPIENFVVGRDDMSVLSGTIAQLQPRGSTDLDLGLRDGYRIANARHGEDVDGRNRRMMLISDALLNTGDVNPNTVTEVARAYEESGVRLTAIGVGRDFNDKVLDMLSEKGKGAYVYLGSEAVVDRIFGLGFRSLTETIAHDVRFALDLPPSLAMERFYGEESSTNPEDVQPINYYAGTSQLFLQDLRFEGAPVPSDVVKLTVEYTDAATGKPSTQVFTATVGELMAADGHNLHKGQALIAWTDMILARSMRNDPCGAPFQRWQDRVRATGPDAELQWLDGLTSPLCGATPRVPEAPIARGVPYKVKIDSDLPIAEVSLTCGGWKDTETLTAGTSVARFEPTPGKCTLVLQGTVPMSAAVDVPATGADVRCVVRGGRVSCG